MTTGKMERRTWGECIVARVYDYAVLWPLYIVLAGIVLGCILNNILVLVWAIGLTLVLCQMCLLAWPVAKRYLGISTRRSERTYVLLDISNYPRPSRN